MIDNKCNNLKILALFYAIFIFTIVVLVSGFIMSNINTTQNLPQAKKTNLSIFYINDVHGQVSKMKRIASAAHKYDEFIKQHPEVSPLKVSSGDICIGADSNLGAASTEFKKLVGIEVETLGNHEFDSDFNDFMEHINNSNTPIVITNIELDKNSPLQGKFKKSYIKTINGEKYGFLGILPPDLEERLKSPSMKQGIKVEDDDDTIEKLQEEVKKLEAQGINKIILLSHGGYPLEQKIAKKVSGIDIIHGGHSHNLIKGIEMNKNYFISPRKEPVIYTQAGGDGHHYGVLDITFQNGIIVAAKNNVIPTMNEAVDKTDAAKIDKYMGQNIVIGKIKHIDDFPKIKYTQEHPLANFMLDAIREEEKVDIAFMNSGSIRGTINKGDVTNQEISLIAPFKNKLCIAYISEADVVQTIENGLKSLQTENRKPGIVQISGLKYVATTDGQLQELYFVKRNGEKEKINFKNPDKNKKYLAAFDDFMARGNEGFSGLHKINQLEKMYDYDKDYPVIQYIKKQNNKPLSIKKDGRIKIIAPPKKQPNELSRWQPSLDLQYSLRRTVLQTDFALITNHQESLQTPILHCKA